jgi:hypothetical protein
LKNKGKKKGLFFKPAKSETIRRWLVSPKSVDELPSIQNGTGAIMGAGSFKLKHSPNKHMSDRLLCVLILKMPLSLGDTQHNALSKK